jgi:hypothetical protein
VIAHPTLILNEFGRVNCPPYFFLAKFPKVVKFDFLAKFAKYAKVVKFDFLAKFAEFAKVIRSLI